MKSAVQKLHPRKRDACFLQLCPALPFVPYEKQEYCSSSIATFIGLVCESSVAVSQLFLSILGLGIHLHSFGILARRPSSPCAAIFQLNLVLLEEGWCDFFFRRWCLHRQS